MMKLGVGLKWGAIAALALGVILISYFVIQSIREGERDKVTIEIQDKQIEKRTVIDRAVKEQKSKTVEESFDYLERRK